VLSFPSKIKASVKYGTISKITPYDVILPGFFCRLFVHKSIVETTGFCSFVLKIKGFLKYISVSKITPYSIISITFSSVSVIIRNFQDDCLVELLTVIQVQM